ncbi:MAG: thermonuclease family protein [Methanobacteriaceae archaeon]|jgi:micrococcal nuclease|nr:thermonuclease family protein [Methanobacteriaceae archaeon]
MKRKTISIIFLALMIGGAILSISNEFIDEDVFAKNSNQGSILIKDSETNKTENITYEAKGKCNKVVDGDTIWVEGVGKIRLVGVNTPEKNEDGFSEAKDFVIEKCLYKTVYLDIDDKKNKDKYNRTLAIVYTNDTNINQELLEKDLGEVMYIPPSEFEKGFK